MGTNKTYMSVDQVAEYIGVDKRTIFRWAEQTDFPAGVKLSPKVRLWTKKSIDDWILGKEKDQAKKRVVRNNNDG